MVLKTILSYFVTLSFGQKFVLSAIFMLILSAAVLSMGYSYDANIYATISYYLLTLGVLNLIYEYSKHDKYTYSRAVFGLALVSYLIYVDNQVQFLVRFMPIYKLFYIIPADAAILIAAYRILKFVEEKSGD